MGASKQVPKGHITMSLWTAKQLKRLEPPHSFVAVGSFFSATTIITLIKELYPSVCEFGFRLSKRRDFFKIQRGCSAA